MRARNSAGAPAMGAYTDLNYRGHTARLTRQTWSQAPLGPSQIGASGIALQNLSTMYPCSLFSITFVLLLLVSRPPMTKTRHVLPTSHPYLQRHSTGHIFTFSSCRRRLYAPFVISARLRVYSRFFSAPIGSTRIYRPDAAPEGIMSDPALLGLPTWDL